MAASAVTADDNLITKKPSCGLSQCVWTLLQCATERELTDIWTYVLGPGDNSRNSCLARTSFTPLSQYRDVTRNIVVATSCGDAWNCIAYSTVSTMELRSLRFLDTRLKLALFCMPRQVSNWNALWKPHCPTQYRETLLPGALPALGVVIQKELQVQYQEQYCVAGIDTCPPQARRNLKCTETLKGHSTGISRRLSEYW